LRSSRLEHQAVVVDASVVQQEDHARPVECPPITKALEQLFDEVLEHRSVDAAFDQLSADYRVMSHSGDQTDRVVLWPGLARRPDRECLGCKAVPA